MPTEHDNMIEGNCGIDTAVEADSERVAELVAEYSRSDAKRSEAEAWIAGTFDGDHYTDLTLALFDLHETDPDRLLGSGVLIRLYQLAKIEHSVMHAKLTELATEQAEAEALQAALDEAEAAAARREAA